MMYIPEADELVCGEEHVQDEAGEGEPLAVEFPEILPYIATTSKVHTRCDCCTYRGKGQGFQGRVHLVGGYVCLCGWGGMRGLCVQRW